ncbi:acyl carrier protein [Catellatospora chokoriensis]|uniref:Carrier domain-containing protein n=1 Tax=Catellatospora chokoriensis TaxID=310353 RepID=A0A8J3NR28_9ACTN|nr:acyl carrier protein [Catellatospora chokoriensis]GIF87680.1 hypothetical protein Cch02nite_11240 [Catellatospora chokoriensis]
MQDRDELSRRIGTAFAAHRPAGCTDLAEDTNFFEAGYTSLRLTAVLATLADEDVALALLDVFRFPTRRSLSAEVARRLGLPAHPSSGERKALPWETRSGD